MNKHILSKTSLIIIIVMIFSYLCVYFTIANKVNFETKIDDLIMKIQGNFVILQDRDPKTSENITNELSHMGGGATNYLLKRIKKVGRDEGNEESLSILTFPERYCLAKIGKATVPYLIKTFEDKTTPISVRWILVDHMEQTKDERVIRPFIKSLSNKNEDIGVRTKVAFSLGFFHSQEVIDVLIKALNDDDYIVRARAATALGEAGSKDAVPYLIKVLPTCDTFLRRCAVEALGRIGDKTAIDSLIPLLANNDWMVRSDSALALGRIKDTKAIPALKKTLGDQHKWVKKNAIIALGKLGDQEGFQLLIEGLRINDIEGDRWEIIKTLAEIGNKQAVEPLKEQLRIKRTGVSLLTTALTALSLAKLGSQDGYEEVLECLKSEDLQIKIAAIQALGEMRDRSAKEPLYSLLNDRHVAIRNEAEKALNKIKARNDGVSH